jgi:hypothetical protein
VIPLSYERFEALIGYTREPRLKQFTTELEAYTDIDEKIITLILFCEIDRDYNLIVLARDERRRYRCFDLDVSIPSRKDACKQAYRQIEKYKSEPPEFFFQADVQVPFIDLFCSQDDINQQRLNPSFTAVSETAGFSAAKGIINEVMPHFVDVDNQFRLKFQTDGFDQRLWELYLFCYFNEEGYRRDTTRQVPDFILQGRSDTVLVEAVTLGLSNKPEEVPSIVNQRDDFLVYMRSRWLRALRKKRNAKHEGLLHYWEQDPGKPFVIAAADFHAPTRHMPEGIEPPSIHYSGVALEQCLYGVTGETRFDEQVVVRPVYHAIPNPESGRSDCVYGFFNEEPSKNVSAVISTSVGTIAKFNRMGRIAGFGSKMVKSCCIATLYDPELCADKPKLCQYDVDDPEYFELWATGVTVYHNPNAIYPLDESDFPKAFHYFFEQNKIVGGIAPGLWHPYNIQTFTWQLYPEKYSKNIDICPTDKDTRHDGL